MPASTYHKDFASFKITSGHGIAVSFAGLFSWLRFLVVDTMIQAYQNPEACGDTNKICGYSLRAMRNFTPSYGQSSRFRQYASPEHHELFIPKHGQRG